MAFEGCVWSDCSIKNDYKTCKKVMDHIVFFISNCIINYVGGKGIRYNMDIVFGCTV